jgi:hypothetical protein
MSEDTFMEELYKNPDKVMNEAYCTEREIILVKMVLGLTGDGQIKTKGQIARVLGISVASVGSRYERVLYNIRGRILQIKREEEELNANTNRADWRNS